MRYQQGILLIGCRNGKGEGKVVPLRILNLMIIFKILNIFSTSIPPPLTFPILLKRINTRQKSIIKQRISFSQIDNINLNGFTLGISVSLK